MKNSILSTTACFVIAQAFFSTTALSFPENTRLGYASCASCHVDPTGGGALNSYGKASAKDYLSMFSFAKDDEEESTWGVIGGNTRTLHVKQDDSDGTARYARILMQAEVQGAAFLSNQIVVAAAGGVYGQELSELKKSEAKPSSYYIMLKPQSYYALKAGLFMPAYGLKIADHSAGIRQFLGPPSRAEKLGFEADILLPKAEINLGGFSGEKGDFAILRSAVYLGKSSQFGASGLWSPEEGYRAGLFGIVGFDGLCVLFELDQVFGLISTDIIGYSKISQEIVKGLNVYTVNDKSWYSGNGVNKVSVGLQWFPFNHTEFSLEMKNYERPIERSYVLMSHLYF